MNTNKEAKETKTYKVLVDDNFHFMDESERYELGEFATYGEAVAAARKIVDDFLEDGWVPGLIGEKLFEAYVNFGEDPWITPDPHIEELLANSKEDFDARHKELIEECLNSPDYLAGKFSSWAYAEKRAAEICQEKIGTTKPSEDK